MTEAAGGELSTGDLWRWVDRLTRPRQHRIVRHPEGGPRKVEHHEVPSLLEQLQEQQATTSSGRTGGGSGSGSRAPLDVATTSLLVELEDLVVEGLVAHGVQPHRTIELVGRVTVHMLDVSASLRALAVIVVGSDDADLIEWWSDKYCSWVLRAEECLDLEAENTSTLPARGIACPTCDVDYVLVDRELEEFREPALVITFRDGQVLHVTCRHCAASWWRGEGIDALTEAFGAALDEPATDALDELDTAEEAVPAIPGPRGASDELVPGAAT